MPRATNNGGPREEGVCASATADQALAVPVEPVARLDPPSRLLSEYLIERVARELWLTAASCKDKEAIWLSLSNNDREPYRRGALAAVKAMREPAMGQCHAALKASRYNSPPLLPECREIWAAEVIWHAMIDDAIAMEARQGGDGETRLRAKHDSAGPQDIAQTPSPTGGNS